MFYIFLAVTVGALFIGLTLGALCIYVINRRPKQRDYQEMISREATF